MSRVYSFRHEGQAGCCNEEVSTLYVAADSRREAEKMLADGKAGCCGHCFSRMLVDGRWNVDIPPVEKPVKACKKCGSKLSKLLGRCTDITCPYNNRSQDATFTED